MASGDSLFRVGRNSSRSVAGSDRIRARLAHRSARARSSCARASSWSRWAPCWMRASWVATCSWSFSTAAPVGGLLLDLVGEQLRHLEQDVDLLLLQLDLRLQTVDLRPCAALGLGLGLAELLELLPDAVQTPAAVSARRRRLWPVGLRGPGGARASGLAP